MHKKRENGFTLIEIMVVIVIIAILASVIYVLFNSARANARDSARMQAIGQINKAIELYILNNGVAPDLGDITCLDVTIPNSDCVADELTHPDNWAQLALQLKPYISRLETDPCPECTANIFGISSAYASEGPGYMYEAPAGTAAYLAENGISAEGLNKEGYRVYVNTLEQQDATFGYGFGLNGLSPNASSDPKEEPKCPYDDKKQCAEWQRMVDEHKAACRSGNRESCDWLIKNGFTVDPKDQENNEDQQLENGNEGNERRENHLESPQGHVDQIES